MNNDISVVALVLWKRLEMDRRSSGLLAVFILPPSKRRRCSDTVCIISIRSRSFKSAARQDLAPVAFEERARAAEQGREERCCSVVSHGWSCHSALQWQRVRFLLTSYVYSSSVRLPPSACLCIYTRCHSSRLMHPRTCYWTRNCCPWGDGWQRCSGRPSFVMEPKWCPVAGCGI